MQIVQRDPQECVFIDDRPENVEGAHAVGMHAIRFENPPQLTTALNDLGVPL
jgi:2-haloacid dehalogenase